MPACVAMTISAMAFSPPANAPFRSPLSSEANGSCCFHSGCCGANTFTRSRAKISWKYIGCSAHRVPSLSKVAMRSAAGTNVGVPCVIVACTNATIACFAVPSFQDGSGSVDCARVATDHARLSAEMTHRIPISFRVASRIDISPDEHASSLLGKTNGQP
jgi:hypothetical protein